MSRDRDKTVAHRHISKADWLAEAIVPVHVLALQGRRQTLRRARHQAAIKVLWDQDGRVAASTNGICAAVGDRIVKRQHTQEERERERAGISAARATHNAAANNLPHSGGKRKHEPHTMLTYF